MFVQFMFLQFMFGQPGLSSYLYQMSQETILFSIAMVLWVKSLNLDNIEIE